MRVSTDNTSSTTEKSLTHDIQSVSYFDAAESCWHAFVSFER